jgi:hypothetical protein
MTTTNGTSALAPTPTLAAKALADIDEDFAGLVCEDEEEATRDVSIGNEDDDDDDYAEYVLDRKLGALAATLRDLLTVKYAPEGDNEDEVTEEPVAYTVAAIKDDLESFRELLEVVGEDGRVESLGDVVARLGTRVEMTNKILFKIHKTLDAVAGMLGAQTEKKAA